MNKSIVLLTIIISIAVKLQAQERINYSKSESICLAEDYDLCQSLGFNRFLVHKNGREYIADSSGMQVVDLAKYDNLIYYGFNDGLMPVEDKVSSKYGYIDRDGKLIIPHVFDSATSFCDSLAIVRKKGKSGIINLDQEEIIPLAYERIGFPVNNKMPVQINGLSGIMDMKGLMLIEPKYTRITSTLGTLFIAEDNKGKTIINSLTLKESAIKYQDVSGFNETRLRFKLKDKWGIMDSEENVIVPNIYDRIGYQYYGRSIIHLNKKQGVIDEDGKQILPPIYNRISVKSLYIKASSDGYSELFKLDGSRLTNDKYSKLRSMGPCNLYLKASIDSISKPLFANGKQIFSDQSFEDLKEISENYLLAKQNNKWFYFELNSNKKLGPYENGTEFQNGFAVIEKKGKHFVIAKEGNIISKGYDEIVSRPTHFLLKNNEKWGVSFLESSIDRPTIYESIRVIDSNIFIAELNGKFGMMKGDETLFPLEYDHIEYDSHRCGYLILTKNQKVGFGDLEGNILMPPQLLDTDWCWLGLLIVESENGVGLIDKEMNYIIEPNYQKITHFKDGQLCAAKKNELYGFINRKGKVVIEPKYTRVHTFSYSRPYAAVEKNNIWQLIDKKGNKYIESEFSSLESIARKHDFFTVGKNGKLGVIDNLGNLVLPIAFDNIKWKGKKWITTIEHTTATFNDRLECIEGCNEEAFLPIIELIKKNSLD